MKCKYCGFEAPVMANTKDGLEFIYAKDMGNNTIHPILKYPKCDKEQ